MPEVPVYQPLNAGNQLVLGMDQHDALVPGPANVPAMPHVDVALIGACGDGGRLSQKVLSDGQGVAYRGHEIKHLVGHVPLGANLTLPLVLAGSKAKLHLGARNVLVDKKPAAAGLCFVELCADPMARPTGVVVTTTSVFVNLDAIDVLFALAGYVFDQVVDAIAAWGIGKLWNAAVATQLKQGLTLAADRVEALARELADSIRDGSPLGALVVPVAEQAVTDLVARASALLEKEVGRRAAAAVEAASDRLGAHGRAVAKAAAEAAEDKVRSLLADQVKDTGLATAALGG